MTSQYAWWLMRERPEWEVLNRGVNGETSDQIRARFTRDVLDASADVVVVIAGVNDLYQGREAADVIEQLRAIYGSAVGAGIPVVAGSIIPFNTATPAQNAGMREVNVWIRRHAEDHLMVHFADTRTAVAAQDQPDRLASSPDELHPTPEGYQQMATVLLPVLDRVISDLTGRTSPA